MSRKENESIVIDGKIEVVVVEIDLNRGVVRLGVEAPRDIPVHRREIHDRIQRDGVDRKKPIYEIDAILGPVTEAELIFRYRDWSSKCGWNIVPDFRWWLWASKCNRRPDGSMVETTDKSYIPFDTWNG